VTIQVVVTYFVALVTLYLLVQVLYIPARLLILLVYNGILGGGVVALVFLRTMVP